MRLRVDKNLVGTKETVAIAVRRGVGRSAGGWAYKSLEGPSKGINAEPCVATNGGNNVGKRMVSDEPW